MHIIQRNLFRLLRAGAFGTEEEIEPMSAWKWRQVILMSANYHIEQFCHTGRQRCAGQFFMQVPAAVDSEWRQLAEQADTQWTKAKTDALSLLQQLSDQQLRPILTGPWTTSLYTDNSGTRNSDVTVFFPFDTQGQKADEWAMHHGKEQKSPRSHVLQYQWQHIHVEHRHRLAQLAGRMSNATLQKIIEQERREEGLTFIDVDKQRIETVAPTLSLLVALTEMVRTLLGGGTALELVVDMGQQLRGRGHRVDFVKLQGWIEKLKIERVARLTGLMLTRLLGFSEDEVPFLEGNDIQPSDDRLASDLLGGAQRTRYFRYLPGEGIASAIASAAHSLGQVEE